MSAEFMSPDEREMVSIAISEFVRGSQLPFDVFLRLPTGRFVLLGRAGTPAALQELNVAKKADTVYVRKDEFQKHIKRNVHAAETLLKREDVEPAKKMAFVGQAVSFVFGEIQSLGINQEVVEHSRIAVESMVHIITAKPDLSALAKIIDSVHGEVVKHSVAVGAVSVMIAHTLGWTRRQTFESLGMGAFFHDVGLNEVPKEILEKPRHELTADERALYESHPFRGAEILRAFPMLSSDVVAIVLEHHENALGLGFPRHVRDVKMNPLSRVVALANAFCDLVMPMKTGAKAMTMLEAVDYIENTLKQPYNKNVFLALKTLVENLHVKPKSMPEPA